MCHHGCVCVGGERERDCEHPFVSCQTHKHLMALTEPCVRKGGRRIVV